MKATNDRAAWLQGGEAACSLPPDPKTKPRRFVLLGAPGAGKGTQAQLLCRHFGACHLSTGDVFRTASACALAPASAAMTRALTCMQKGELVPDQTVLNLIQERLRCLHCHGGFLLDGFPRTTAQAAALEKILKSQGLHLNAVLTFRLSKKTILARLSGRRSCADCRAVFHLDSMPPKKAGICDHCGGPLLQRQDDRPESIRIRLAAYAKTAQPLKRFYRRRKLLVTIAADGNPQQTFANTLTALAKQLAPDHEPEFLCGK